MRHVFHHRICSVLAALLVMLLVVPGEVFATTVFLTSGTSWNTPADWDNAANSIECIGSGADGRPASDVTFSGGGGGGGGAYAKITNLTISGAITYQIGASATSTSVTPNTARVRETYFNGTASSSASLSCSWGKYSGDTTGGVGGATNASTGDTKYAGGNGGTATAFTVTGGGGGGGSAGPTGVGQNGGGSANADPSGGGGGGGSNGGSSTAGSASTGTGGANGGNGTGGSGAGTGGSSPSAGTSGGGGSTGSDSGSSNGAAGGCDTAFDTSYGACGGGGGSGGCGGFASSGDGGNGGAYGGGGGGSGASFFDPPGIGGVGGTGLIVITYTPSVASSGRMTRLFGKTRVYNGKVRIFSR